MLQVDKVIKLKNILEEDFERRKIVINAFYDAFKSVFSSNSVEKLRVVSPMVFSVRTQAINARNKIQELKIDDPLFRSAQEILEKEHQYLSRVYENYVEKTFFRDADRDWVLKNLDIDSLKTFSIELNRLRMAEELLFDQINRFFGDVSEQKRIALGRFK